MPRINFSSLFLGLLTTMASAEPFNFTSLFGSATGVNDWLVEFRRDIHMHPEIGLNTYRTRDKVVEELRKMGITPTLGWAKGPSCQRDEGAGIVFDLGTGSQPCVMLRADMDALPVKEDNDLPFKSTEDGKMHACGHDAHTTMLLGAVKLLKDRESAIPGTVRIMFQPGEEGWFGGKYMVNEGVLKQQPDVKHGLALHVIPRTPSGHFATGIGPTMAGGGKFNITVHGKGGHAGAPYVTIDPIVCAASIIQELQHIVSRESIGGGSRTPFLLSVTQIHAGSTHNVIPNEASFGGSARAMTNKGIEHLHSRIKEVAELVAKAHRANVTVWFDDIVPPLVVDKGVRQVLSKLATEASAVQIDFPASEFVYGMEDFAFVANEVPSAFYGIGIGSGISTQKNPPTNVELHSSKFVLDEMILPRGAAFMAAGAVELLASLSKTGKRDEL